MDGIGWRDSGGDIYFEDETKYFVIRKIADIIEIMWYCYLIENLVNGKLYVGKAKNVEERWKGHKLISRNGKAKSPKYSYLHAAITKYGVENFTVKTIKGYASEKETFDNEKSHIAQLRAEGYELYNLTDGGEGKSGCKASDETKKKISLIVKNRVVSEETKEKMRGENNPFYGKTHSDEAKRKISLAQSARPHGKMNLSEEQMIKKSNKLSGENNPRAKLNWKKVNNIRKLFSNGFSRTELSTKYGVSRTTISSIVANKSWIKK